MLKKYFQPKTKRKKSSIIIPFDNSFLNTNSDTNSHGSFNLPFNNPHIINPSDSPISANPNPSTIPYPRFAFKLLRKNLREPIEIPRRQKNK